MNRSVWGIALLLLVQLSFSNPLHAQFRRRASSDGPRFSVGVAPFSLLLPSGKVNLHGEWAYADDKSVSVLVGIPRSSKAPNWLSEDIRVEGSGKVRTDEFHSFGMIVENRFYIGAEAPRGFYLAPYARYNRVRLTHTTENPESQGETKIVGAFGGFGIGAAAGLQFRLGSNVSLDATVAGVDLKWMRGSLTYASTDPNNDIVAFRDKVQDAVEHIPLIGSKLSADIEGDKVRVRTPGLPLPAYRFNLTVNYLF